MNFGLCQQNSGTTGWLGSLMRFSTLVTCFRAAGLEKKRYFRLFQNALIPGSDLRVQSFPAQGYRSPL